jgi:phosphatidylglycerophosphate synthase
VRTVQQALATTANRITSVRALLAVVVALLVARSFVTDAAAFETTVLACIAILLDGVDGRVARRSATVSSFGARFDMEVDAFLILVLSVQVGKGMGWWVLSIGLMRYSLLVATWALPWLAEPLPPRQWAKVVAVVQGVALTVGVSGLVPDQVLTLGLAVALGLLLESFGRQVHDLHMLHAVSGPSRVEPAEAISHKEPVCV